MLNTVLITDEFMVPDWTGILSADELNVTVLAKSLDVTAEVIGAVEKL